MAFCHDSVSCDKFPRSFPFPVARGADYEHVGQVFDGEGNGRQHDIDKLQESGVNKKCLQVSSVKSARNSDLKVSSVKSARNSDLKVSSVKSTRESDLGPLTPSHLAQHRASLLKIWDKVFRPDGTVHNLRLPPR